MFKSIENNTTAEIVEKKSKFICNLYYIESVEEAEEIIKQVNKKYFDARHNCYAFRICTENGIIERFSDDGEPSGTAGGPMLNILSSQNLSNILVIVTRYFGGILLGTGGLVKAYSGATKEALDNADIVEKELGKEIRIRVDYTDLSKAQYFLGQKNAYISNMDFAEYVDLFIDMTNDQFVELLKERNNLNFKLLGIELVKEKFISI